MKYVLVIYEGAADVASDELEGATPLQLARNVHATSLMQKGMAGYLSWPDDRPVTRLEQSLAVVLGIPLDEARTLRRGPVEAAALKGNSAPWAYAYRGNFATTDGRLIRESRVSGLSLEETKWLADAVAEKTGTSGATLSVSGAGRVSVMLDDLHGVVDEGDFPAPGTELGLEEEHDTEGSFRQNFMRDAAEALTGLSLNEVRVDLGENPADALWLWAGGPPAVISRPFLGAPLRAVMITNSPLGKGMAALSRMKCHQLGNLWADISKPELMEKTELTGIIREHELTIIYVEAPEEQGRYGTPVEKVKSIDRIDIHVLGRVVEAIGQLPDVRLMLVALPEENVAMATTPILITGANVTSDRVERWDEASCLEGAVGNLAAPRCMTRLLGD